MLDIFFLVIVLTLGDAQSPNSRKVVIPVLEQPFGSEDACHFAAAGMDMLGIFIKLRGEFPTLSRLQYDCIDQRSLGRPI